MIIACWSVKGGVGTTTVVASAALGAAERRGERVLAVDLAGDLPYCLGAPEPSGPGVADWSAAGPDVPADALARLVVPVAPGLDLLPRGAGPMVGSRAELLVQLLAATGRTVVVDCGRIAGRGLATVVAAQAERSLLVTRLCTLALRRAVPLPLCPSGVVVVREAGRAIPVELVAERVGAPVVAELAVDPAVSRAVDAGLSAARLPRRFAVAVRAVAA